MPPLSHSGPGAASPAENLAAKQSFLAQAQALARDADGRINSTGLNGVLLAWARTDSAGPDHDVRLWWLLKEACADFYSRCSGEAFQSGDTPQCEHRLTSGHTVDASCAVTNSPMDRGYARLGTVRSGSSLADAGPKAALLELASPSHQIFPGLGAAPIPLSVAPRRAKRVGPHAETRGRRGRLPCRPRRSNTQSYAALGTVRSGASITAAGPKSAAAAGTVSSQAGRIVPTKAERRVGGGKAGELTGVANLADLLAATLGYVRQLGVFSPRSRTFLRPYLPRVASSPLGCSSPQTEVPGDYRNDAGAGQ